MKKDIKYIIKKIIIGVGIALLMILVKATATGTGFILNTYAMEVNATPNDIVLNQVGQNSIVWSPTTNTWNGETVYAIPGNISYDWGSGSSLYFRYPQNSGANYCADFNNRATFTASLYNATSSSIGSQIVKWEDTTNSSTKTCAVEQDGNRLDITCTNVYSNHGFNIMLQNVIQGRWGIIRNLNFSCVQNGEDISASINANNNQNTQNIINNNNQNTSSINNNINNQTSQINGAINGASSNIIHNQNQNTQKEIDSQIVCRSISSEDIQLKGYLRSNGNFVENNSYGTTRYYPIDTFSKILVIKSAANSQLHQCFYDSNRTLISCSNVATLQVNDFLTIPTDSAYVRFSFHKTSGPYFKICRPGNLSNYDFLTDDDITTASNDFDSFMHEVNPNLHGLSDIITAPLRLVSSLTSSTCQPLSIPLPFVNQNATLPCMVPIYQQYFGDWFILYQTITTGIIAYWVGVNTFRKIQDFLDPQDDKVEVFDL